MTTVPRRSAQTASNRATIRVNLLDGAAEGAERGHCDDHRERRVEERVESDTRLHLRVGAVDLTAEAAEDE